MKDAENLLMQIGFIAFIESRLLPMRRKAIAERALFALADAAEDHMQATCMGDIVATGERLKQLLTEIDRFRGDQYPRKPFLSIFE